MRNFRFKSHIIIGLSGLSAAFVVGVPLSASAAPCCGGASALPALLTGDDRAQMGLGISSGSVIGDVSPEGDAVFRAPDDTETSRSLTLSGAYRVSDLFQAGMEVPLIERTREGAGSSARAMGMGDVRVDSAYEFLPEWSYSAWRPHGFVFAQVTLPTGPSVYDASSPYLLDARGRGFFSTAIGIALIKTVGNWDFLLSAEGHRSFSRSITGSDGVANVLTPGWGASGVLSTGFTPGGGSFRAGLAVSPVYEGAIHSLIETESPPEHQLVWNTSASLGYLIRSDWSAALVYTDQTLLGPAENVSLSRTLGLNVQKRWEL